MIEEKLSETLGTRVHIEKTRNKGRIHIDFFSEEELRAFLEKLAGGRKTVQYDKKPEASGEDESHDELKQTFPEDHCEELGRESCEEVFSFDNIGQPNNELPEEIIKREEYNKKLMEELSGSEFCEEPTAPCEAAQPEDIEELRNNFTI